MLKIFKNLRQLESQQKRLCEIRGEIVQEAEDYLKNLDDRSGEYDQKILHHSNLISHGIQQLEQNVRKRV